MSSGEQTFTPNTGDGGAEAVQREFGPDVDVPGEEPTEESTSAKISSPLVALAALVLAGATVFVTQDVAGTGLFSASTAALFAAHLVLATIAMAPLRWGFYVMPAVAALFYGYGIFEIMNGNVLFGGVLGTSFVGPASGVVVAFLSQVIYTLVGEG